MKILGLSAYYHDSSACLIVDGKIFAACQEERLTRIKHDAGFPARSILYCLQEAGCRPGDIDHVVFFEKPFLKFERLLETYLAFAPRGFTSFRKAIPLWLKEKLFQKKLLAEELQELGFSSEQCRNLLFSTHHLSHAASAYYPSPFKRSLVLTMDGVGEWDTTTVYLAEENALTKLQELRFPHSLGLLYSAFTYYCGFKVNSGEYKLMGLAPYGIPRFADLIKENLIHIKEDGSFKLNLDYFDYCTGLTMTNKKFNTLFSNCLRTADEPLTQAHMDLAASIQVVLEEVVLKICRHLAQKYQTENLCLAGGVALNCVANGKIYQENLFKNIWVQPAAGDAGGALGAALAVYHQFLGKPRQVVEPDAMQGSYLGPSFSDSQIESFLRAKNIVYRRHDQEETLLQETASLVEKNNVVGWFQGRMEFGPRALGNRSIIANPRSADMQKKLNLKIKFRESFRPFAPAVLEENVSDWFDFKDSSPYMLMVAQVHADKLLPTENKYLFGIDRLNQIRSLVPSITHVDGSARLQTVSGKSNRLFHKLITEFAKLTNTPILVNTSFNIRGEPIVCTPEDAYRCFMGTDMDVLVMGSYLLLKSEQPEKNKSDYQKDFELD
jgi:carbamoyltransferase